MDFSRPPQNCSWCPSESSILLLKALRVSPRPSFFSSPVGPEILRLLCPKNFSQTSPMQLTLISTFIYMYLCIRTWRIRPAKPFFYLHCLYGVFSFFIFLSLILNLLLNQPQLLQRVFDFHHRVHKTWSILASLIHFSM